MLVIEETKQRHTAFTALNSCLWQKDVSLPPNAWRMTFTWEIYFLLTGGQRGGSESSSAPAVSQVDLIQNH